MQRDKNVNLTRGTILVYLVYNLYKSTSTPFKWPRGIEFFFGIFGRMTFGVLKFWNFKNFEKLFTRRLQH